MNAAPDIRTSAKRLARRGLERPRALAGRLQHRAELAHLRHAPWHDGGEMDRLRLRLLNRSLARAARHSPFYRAVLGGAWPRLHDLAELASLPVTSRSDIKASGLDRAIPGSLLSRRRVWGTSGASGRPYRFAIDTLYPVRHAAQRAFVYLQAGLAPGAKIAEILPTRHRWLKPQFEYPTFRRSIVGYRGESITEGVVLAKPELLYGNLSHLLQVAEELDGAGQVLDVPFVCSSSETLHAADAARLAACFSARVFEIYGSAEGGNLAFRLTTGGPWTVMEPRVLVEVLDGQRQPVGDGEVGEVVITTLTEPTSPLVRYATGDLARVGAGSAAGTSGLRLSTLEGRTSDGLVDRLGNRVSLWTVANAQFWVSDVMARHVWRWRIHQSADGSVDVYVEPTPNGTLTVIAPGVTHTLQSMLGPVPVRIVETTRVHDPAAGKFRSVTSDVYATARYRPVRPSQAHDS